MKNSEAPNLRLLESVGVDELEERAYTVLLDHPGATLDEISRHLDLPTRETRILLDAIAGKGLATQSADRKPRFLPVEPDVAIEALIVKRKQELELTRTGISRLRKRAQDGLGDGKSNQRIVELIPGTQLQYRLCKQMQRNATKEALCMERPPYIFTPPDHVEDGEIEAIARGVSCRNLVDSSVLGIPGAIARLRDMEKQGEVARVFSGLPTKLLIFDRKLSVMPLDLEHLEGPMLLVRPSALLDALCAFFELIWERATPIAFTRSGALKRREVTPRLPADIEQLIPLLAAGVNDKAIAHELGMSRRTFQRWIADFMSQIDARTRFQAGWLAALRLHPALVRREHAQKRGSPKTS